MKRAEERDRAIERVLEAGRADDRRHRQPGAACLDAETLAAWTEGALSPADRTAAEAHAAGCLRCQALLAAMMRATPDERAVEPSTARRWAAWLVPLTAAAAALLIWVAVPPQQGPLPVQSVAENAPAAPPAAERPQARTTPQVAAPPPPPPARAASPADASAAARNRLADPAPSTRGAAARGSLERREASADARRREAAKEVDRLASAPTPTQPTAPAPTAPAAAAAPVAPPPPAPMPTESAKLGTQAGRPLPRAAAGAPPSVRAPQQQAVGGRVATLAETVTVGTEVTSPDGMSRWRFQGDRATRSVERSADGGSSWIEQRLPVAARLLAGHSPSRDVCWLVGERGVIVVTADGRTWRRVPFAEGVNIVSVRATDARNASIKLADGREFTTTDAGATWSPGG